MTLIEVKRIVESNDHVWQGWWPTLRNLDPRQLYTPIPGSYPYILSTLEHAVRSELWWQMRLESRPVSEDPLPLTLFSDIDARWHTLRDRRLVWIAKADPNSDVRFKGDDGSVQLIRTWECIIHIASHSHFHRGQLVLQLRQIDLVPPSHHMIGRFMSP
jgi:uncharacterized damage-inducible protein DinB